MSGFSLESLNDLSFDFTEIPHASGTGFCTGKGVMDEPSKDRIEAFFDSINALRKRVADAAKDKSGKKLEAITEDAEELLTGMRQALSDVGNGSPTVAQLEQLPPRALRGFSDWVQQELTDPKG